MARCRSQAPALDLIRWTAPFRPRLIFAKVHSQIL
jgi:hypothetical protein